MREKRCPKCGVEHPETATYCGCGFKWAREQAQATQSDHQCAYEQNGRRCKFPATNFQGTNGLGVGYCRHHDNCHDADMGAQIIDESYYADGLKNVDIREQQRNAWLKEHGLDKAGKEELREWCRKKLAGMQQRIRNAQS